MGRIHAESMLLQQGSMIPDSCSLPLLGGEGAEAEHTGFQTGLSLYMHFWTLLAGILGAFQVQAWWKHRWLIPLWSATAKEGNTVNSFWGLTGRSVILFGRGTSGIHLASLSLQLSIFSNCCQFYCILQHCSKAECRECYMKNQQCMGDVDCCWWVLQGFVIWSLEQWY